MARMNKYNFRISDWIGIAMLLAFIVANYFLISNYERTAKAEMRPYVQVKGAKFNDLRVNRTFNIKLEIINTGKTPAYNVKIENCELKFAGTENYESKWVDSTGIQIVETNFLLAANNSFDNNMQFDRIMTEEDSILILKNKGLIAFTGDITYEDIFRDDHFTRFYLQFDTRTKEFVYYTDFNEADRKPYSD